MKNGNFTIEYTSTLTDFFKSIKAQLLEITDWTVKSESEYSISFLVADGYYINISDDTIEADSTTTSNSVTIKLCDSTTNYLLYSYSVLYCSAKKLATDTLSRKIKLSHIKAKSGDWIIFRGYNETPSIMLSSTYQLGFNVKVRLIDSTTDAIGVYYNCKLILELNTYTTYNYSTISSCNVANYLMTQPLYIKDTYISGSITGMLISSPISAMCKYSFNGKSYISGNTSLLLEV